MWCINRPDLEAVWKPSFSERMLGGKTKARRRPQERTVILGRCDEYSFHDENVMLDLDLVRYVVSLFLHADVKC